MSVATSDAASGGMSPDAMEAFLACPVIARLATASGQQPRVLPMWFTWDGHSIWMETSPDFPNARVLRADPRAALTIDETLGGLRFRAVIMRGSIEVIEGPNELVRERVVGIYRKYLGADIGHHGARRMLEGRHILLRFTPAYVVTWDDTSSEVAAPRSESIVTP